MPTPTPSSESFDTSLPPRSDSADRENKTTVHFNLSRIGEYLIDQQIARAGQGIVYLARHRFIERTVALKVLLAGHLAGQEDRERFRVTASAVCRLDHPNIVRLFEFGEHDNNLYLAMEYVPGHDLKCELSLLKQQQKMPTPDKVIDLMLGLIAALDHMHKQRIIHRDLKPANILLLDPKAPPVPPVPGAARQPMWDRVTPLVAKITDFGLAKRIDLSGDTPSYAVMGSVPYLSPEQAEGRSREVEPAADVYSLGVILYELATLCLPFQGLGLYEYLHQILNEAPKPPREWHPGIHPVLEAIILRCLAKRPGERYPSVAALGDALRELRAQLHSSEVVIGPAIPGYELHNRIGETQTYIDYAATQRPMRRPVRLRLFRERSGPSPEWQALCREAELLAGLETPQIARIYDLREHDGLYFCASELLDGETLASAMQRLGKIPFEAVLVLMERVAAGLGVAHQGGIVHRGMVPQNIFLVRYKHEATRDSSKILIRAGLGDPKICDFSLAFRRQEPSFAAPAWAPDEEQECFRRSASKHLYTKVPIYLAPELVRGDPRQATPAADVWSLGIILYQLLTGEHPCCGMEYFARIADKRMPTLRSHAVRLPEGLIAVVDQCLFLEPTRRYETADQLAMDLRRIRKGKRPSVVLPSVWERIFGRGNSGDESYLAPG